LAHLIGSPETQEVIGGMGRVVLNVVGTHADVVPLVDVLSTRLVGRQGAHQPILGRLDHSLVLRHKGGIVPQDLVTAGETDETAVHHGLLVVGDLSVAPGKARVRGPVCAIRARLDITPLEIEIEAAVAFPDIGLGPVQIGRAITVGVAESHGCIPDGGILENLQGRVFDVSQHSARIHADESVSGTVRPAQFPIASPHDLPRHRIVAQGQELVGPSHHQVQDAAVVGETVHDPQGLQILSGTMVG
jgi:hypothetical protein